MALSALVAVPATGQFPASATGQVPTAAAAGRVSLASQTSWVTAGGTFDLRLDLAGVRRPEDLAVAIDVHAAITARTRFQDTLDGGPLGREIWKRSVPLVGLDFDATGALRLPLALDPPGAPRDPERLPALGPGVYPVRVALAPLGGGDVLDAFTTHLVRLPDDGEATPLAVAWVQPFAAEPALAPDGTVTLDDTSIEVLGAVAGALAASPGVPVTVVPTPETIDALDQTGAEGVLDDLAGGLAGRQVLAGPYVDVDVDALLASGLEGELDAQLARGAGVLDRVMGASPPLRTLSSDARPGGAALGRLQTLGVRRVVLPEGAFAALDRRLTLAGPFALSGGAGQAGALGAASVDPALATHFLGEDQVLAAHRLLADLAVLFFDAPGRARRGVVVRPPQDWTASPELLEVVLGALGASPVPMLRPVTIDGLFDLVPPVEADGEALVRRLAPEPAPPLGVPAGELRTARTQLGSFATMVGPERPEVDTLGRLLLVAETAGFDAGRRRAYLEGFDARRAATVAMVGVLDRGSYRLTAREGTVPLTLVNRNPYPVEVSLVLESDKLDFLDEGVAGGDSPGRRVLRRTLTQENTAVGVRVRARTSGAFPLVISVTAPDGRLPVAASRVTVRSTAASGVGIILSVGALAFLALWWGARWRRARRQPRLGGWRAAHAPPRGWRTSPPALR